MKQSYYAYVPYNREPVMTPYGHQLEAISKFRDSDSIALFFEMGCGKTFTTLCLAEDKFRRGLINGMLVIAPNDVHRQWYDDVVNGVTIGGKVYREMGVDLEAQCVGGRGGAKEICNFADPDTFKFVSVNIDTFSQPTKWQKVVGWARSQPTMIVIDEATCIKNPESNRSKRLLYEFNNILSKDRRGRPLLHTKNENTKYRCILTGTPVTNGTLDLWALMEFLKPNYFGRNYYSFRTYYSMYTILKSKDRGRDVQIPLTQKTWEGVQHCRDYETAFYYFGVTQDTYFTIKHQSRYMGAYKHADELKLAIDPVSMFKRLTECVDMPEQSYTVRRTGLSAEQKKAYKTMEDELQATYKGKTMTAKNSLVAAMRLQQISDGFIVNTEQQWIENADDEEQDLMPNEIQWLGESCPKLDALMRDVEESDKPLIIMTKYSAEAAKIYELCSKAGYRTGLFTGWKVIGGIEDFKAGKLDILVANSNKIARGFNLQVSHTILFYSNSFSMEVRQQAEFRTFRMGQKEKCVYVDYIASDVDQIIYNALKLKKGLLDYIRESKPTELVF